MQWRGTEFGIGKKRNGKTFLLGIQEKPPRSRSRLFRSMEAASPVHATFLPTRNSPTKIVLVVSFDHKITSSPFCWFPSAKETRHLREQSNEVSRQIAVCRKVK